MLVIGLIKLSSLYTFTRRTVSCSIIISGGILVPGWYKTVHNGLLLGFFFVE
jgi:hypothetical protein